MSSAKKHKRPNINWKKIPFSRLKKIFSTHAVHSLDQALNLMTSLVIKSSIILLAGTLSFILYKELQDESYIIKAFDVPRQFEYDGYDGLVVANRVLDQVGEIQRIGQTSKQTNEYHHTLNRSLMDLQIMGMGFSVNAMAYHLRNALGMQHNQIKGEIVRKPKTVELTLRMTNYPKMIFSEPILDTLHYATALDSLFLKAGMEIVKQTEPYQLAVYYSRTDQNEKAIDMIRYLISKKAAERKWAYNLWGNILKDEGTNAGRLAAEEKYKKAIQLDPTYVLPYYNWGVDLMNAKLYDEAEKRFKQALQFDPDYPPGIAQYQNQKKHKKALPWFKRAAKLQPNTAWILNSWASSERSLKNYEKAEELYWKGYNYQSENAWVIANGISMLNEIGQAEKATKWYNEIKDLHPANYNMVINVVYSLYDEGKTDQALELVDEFLGRNDDVEATYPIKMVKSVFLASLQRFAEADSLWSEFSETVPNTPLPYVIKAAIEHYKDDSEAFVANLEKGFKLGFLSQNSDILEEKPFTLRLEDPNYQALLKKYGLKIEPPTDKNP